MLTSTVKAIDILLGFFSENQQEGLAITLNNIKITLLDQFISRWAESEPRYPLPIFKVKAAMILHAHQNLTFRIIEFSKPEFQDKLNQQLLDLDSFIKSKKIHYDTDLEGKKIHLNQNDSINVLRSANKNRGGNAESGQEFVELDKTWDLEDNEFLQSGLIKKKISANLNFDGTKKNILDSTSVLLNVEGENNLTFYNAPENPINPKELTDEEPTLHSISVSQARQKNINEHLTNVFNYSEDKSKKEGDSTVKEYSSADVFNKLFSFKLRNLREIFFQNLDSLFLIGCQ